MEMVDSYIKKNYELNGITVNPSRNPNHLKHMCDCIPPKHLRKINMQGVRLCQHYSCRIYKTEISHCSTSTVHPLQISKKRREGTKNSSSFKDRRLGLETPVHSTSPINARRSAT